MGDAGFVGNILINSLSLVVGFYGILGEEGVVVFPAPFLSFEKVPPSNDPFFYEMSLINEMSPRITGVLEVPFSFMRFGALKG